MEELLKELQNKANVLVDFAKSQELRLDKIYETTDKNFEVITNGFKSIDAELAALKKEHSNLHGKVDTLNKDTSNNFTAVDGKLESIHGELLKVNKATGYENLYNNLKAL